MDQTGRPWLDPQGRTADRVAALVAAMTREEKVALALGDEAAVAHLGIPPLLYTDSGSGVRDGDRATAFPVTLMLAATFDVELADAYGAAVGEEARAAGRNVLLGPAVDLVRTPLGGRAAESFGEDPHLAGVMAAAHVRAVQRHHVVAMLKHCVANNFEHGRTGFGPIPSRSPAVDVVVGERALRELYLEPVRAALLAGGALSVMGSYNRLNGSYACQSRWLLTTVLREDWGWPGFVAPDFLLAVRDDVAAANAGLDVAALGGPGGRTAEDFTSGRIPPERLEELVTRVVHAMVAGGLVDHPVGPDGTRPLTTPEHVAVAARAARDGMVLLRNEGVLPLAGDVPSIAVIGPAGEDALFTLGGSGAVALWRERVVTPLAGIRARAGAGTRVAVAQGTLGDVRLPVLPAEHLAPSSGPGPGLYAEYWGGDEAAGAPVRSGVEPGLDVAHAPDGVSMPWCARWTGTLTPAVSGPHRFSLTGAGVAELFLDDAVVVAGMREADRFAGGPELPLQGVAHLEAGRPVALRVEYWTGPALNAPPFHPTDVWGEELPVGHVPRLQLGWEPPGDAIERAARLAAESDVAVVVVGASSGEGADRTSLALPGDQDALVGAVARANPRTVVVLNTPGPVLMPWLPEVAAVLQAWYPGQQFGDALAAVLFGDDDPGGRLPVTFPATAGQGPVTGPERYPGVDGVARYDEDLLIGYRWFDAHAQAPLFPFGHGLSYTSFAYGELRATVGAGAGLVRAVVEVANTGDRAGSEVVQLYVSAPPAAEAPPAVLAGFRKVRLEPGRSTEVGFELPVDALAVYGSAGGRRVLHPGRYGLAVGASSRDLRASAAVELGTA